MAYAAVSIIPPFMKNSTLAGSIFLYFAMAKAANPIPPFETPCLRSIETPQPRIIDPKRRSTHRFVKGETKYTSKKFTDTEVIVMVMIVPTALIFPR
ncbi:hypothetical protein D3C76_1273240 [compost metagenome]